MLELFATITPFVNLGAIGIMMVWVWRIFLKKDKKSYEMIDAQNQERKEMYEAQTEIIREVTTALVDKNNTDDKMAAALMRLAEEFKEFRATLKEDQDGTPQV